MKVPIPNKFRVGPFKEEAKRDIWSLTEAEIFKRLELLLISTDTKRQIEKSGILYIIKHIFNSEGNILKVEEFIEKALEEDRIEELVIRKYESIKEGERTLQQEIEAETLFLEALWARIQQQNILLGELKRRLEEREAAFKKTITKIEIHVIEPRYGGVVSLGQEISVNSAILGPDGADLNADHGTRFLINWFIAQETGVTRRFKLQNIGSGISGNFTIPRDLDPYKKTYIIAVLSDIHRKKLAQSLPVELRIEERETAKKAKSQITLRINVPNPGAEFSVGDRLMLEAEAIGANSDRINSGYYPFIEFHWFILQEREERLARRSRQLLLFKGRIGDTLLRITDEFSFDKVIYLEVRLYDSRKNRYIIRSNKIEIKIISEEEQRRRQEESRRRAEEQRRRQEESRQRRATGDYGGERGVDDLLTYLRDIQTSVWKPGEGLGDRLGEVLNRILTALESNQIIKDSLQQAAAQKITSKKDPRYGKYFNIKIILRFILHSDRISDPSKKQIYDQIQSAFEEYFTSRGKDVQDLRDSISQILRSQRASAAGERSAADDFDRFRRGL